MSEQLLASFSQTYISDPDKARVMAVAEDATRTELAILKVASLILDQSLQGQITPCVIADKLWIEAGLVGRSLTKTENSATGYIARNYPNLNGGNMDKGEKRLVIWDQKFLKRDIKKQEKRSKKLGETAGRQYDLINRT